MAITATTTTTVSTQTQVSTDTVQGKDITGAGLLNSNGPAPDIQNQPGYSAIIESLARAIPQMSSGAGEIFLAEVAAKMKDVEEQAQTDRYKTDQEAKRASLAEKKEKLDEADKKIQESIDARKSGNIFDIIKMVFQAIAAALTMVLGALLAPVCPVLGGLLIAAAVVSIVMLIDAAVQQGTGMGIMGNIVKAAGGSPEDIAKADMGFRLGMAAIGLVLAIATAAVSGGATIAAQLAQLSTAVSTFKTIATAINTGISIGSAGLDIGATVVRTEGAEKSAEAKNLQASAKDMEGLLAQLDDFIDMALSRLIAANNRFNEILDSITDMMQDKAQSLSNARFTA
jgi:hypothetical protein